MCVCFLNGATATCLVRSPRGLPHPAGRSGPAEILSGPMNHWTELMGHGVDSICRQTDLMYMQNNAEYVRICDSCMYVYIYMSIYAHVIASK